MVRALSTVVLLCIVACGDDSGVAGGRDAGTGRGDAASDGSLRDATTDGAATRDSGGCEVTIASVSPSTVTQGATGVTLLVVGTGFASDASVTIVGVPAPLAAGASATMISVSAPDATFSAVGGKTIVVSRGGCSATTMIFVRSAAALAVAGWPRHHHDNQNSSVSRAIVAASPVLRWSHPLGSEASGVSSEGGGAWSAPVSAPIAGLGDDEFTGGMEVVWLGAPDGTVFSWLAADGTERFHFTSIGPAPYGIDSVPAVRADGTLYVGISDSNLYALTPAGMQLWSYGTRGTSDASAIVAEDGTLLYASDDGHVYALDQDGTLAWDTTDPGEVDSAFATSPQGLGDLSVEVFYAGGQNGWFALDPATGHTLWMVPAVGPRGAGVSSPVVSPDGSTIYGIDTGGHVLALADDGTERWHADLPPGGGNTPALVGDTLYAVAIDGHLRALDARDGSVRWDRDVHNTLFNASGELPTPSVDATGTVFVFSDDGNLYAFAADGAPRMPIHVCPPRAEFVVPQVAIGRDGALYVAGTDDVLYAFR